MEASLGTGQIAKERVAGMKLLRRRLKLQRKHSTLNFMDLIPFLLVASALMGSGFVIGLHFGEARQIEARRREREFDRRLQEQLAKLRNPEIIDFEN